MSIEKNVQTVKDFLAALGRCDEQGLMALADEHIEWIIPGEDWPLAGTHLGHAGLENLLKRRKTQLKLPSQSLPSSSRRETGFWWSVLQWGEPKPRARSGRIIDVYFLALNCCEGKLAVCAAHVAVPCPGAESVGLPGLLPNRPGKILSSGGCSCRNSDHTSAEAG